MNKIISYTLAITITMIPLLKPQKTYAEVARGSETVNFVELTPETKKSINKGLAYLAKIQNKDGSFPSSTSAAGITAIACMAFLANGHIPGRGKYGKVVENGLKFVLTCSKKTGLIAKNVSHGPMYGHGFATLFLGEVYGMTGNQKLKAKTREALIKAVRLIVSSQNKEGGWRYQPVPNDADISVTICQIMALRSAKNAGIEVPKKTLDKAIQYVKICQSADGGFKYTASSGGSAFARSGAGLASLYYAGVYNGKSVESGLKYMNVQLKSSRTFAGNSWFYYGHYYASQAMFQAGGKHWAAWYPKIRQALIKKQSASGSFTGGGYGDGYSSGMAIIILSTPNRLLPIFQR